MGMPLAADIVAPSALTVSGNTTLDGTHSGKTILVDATAGSITLAVAAIASLPEPWFVRLVRIDASANTVTVDPNGSETIDGRTSARLLSQYDAATVRKAGPVCVTEHVRWRRPEIVHNSSTTFTVLNEVPLGCLDYEVIGCAAGGSGAGSATSPAQRKGGGAAGAAGRRRIRADLDTSLTLTIGTGGAPVAASAGGANGNAGGNTTVVGMNCLGTLTLGGGGGGQVSTAGGDGGQRFSGAWDETLKGGDGFLFEQDSVAVGYGGDCPWFGLGGCANISTAGGARRGRLVQQPHRQRFLRGRRQRPHQDQDMTTYVQVRNGEVVNRA